ncbi:membrane protein insertase [Alcaligenes faecalis subsp. faecalis NCIB 8687]|nr:membrane protein insertase [Alcaligenes faecalis subsp. faecalis NCIB 8687]
MVHTNCLPPVASFFVLTLILKLGNNLYAVRTLESVGSIDAGQSKAVDASLWVGPQDQKAMSQLATGLDLVVDYGWLTIISKPLFKLLTWLHSLLGFSHLRIMLREVLPSVAPLIVTLFSLSNFSQMVAITFLMMISATTGLAAAGGFIRGLSRKRP